MADYLPPVVAKLTGDDSNLTTVLTRAKEKVHRFADDIGRIKATVKVDADLTALDRKLQEARDKKVDLTARLKLEAGAQQRIATQLRGAPVDLTVKADLDTSGLERKLQQVKGKKIDLTARVVLGSGEAEKIQRQIGRLKGTATVGLRLDDGAQQAITARLNRGAIDVTIKPVMDQTALRRVQIILGELGKRINVSIRPTVDEPSALRTLARLDRLSADRTSTIRIRTIGGSGTPSTGGSSSGSKGTADAMGTLISFAPALAPVAAAATAVAASVAAATVAVGAFGAAVMPQIKSLSDAATAQTKYTAAVTKYGPQSKQAVAAQTAFADALSAMPPATRQAAGGLMVLKGSFKAWSDSLAGVTMAPITRSFAVIQAILPKLTPMVQGASTQFGRLVTAAGGAVSSPGFDSLAKRFSDFANKTLTSATNAIIHFSRVLAGGAANGAFSQFMAYAKANGPLVKDTLANISKAVLNILKAASQAGPGMLSLVNAVAKLVAALPPSFVAVVLQAYSAFKLFGLLKPGFTAVSEGVTSLMAKLTALRATSLAAGGGMAGLKAAFLSLNAATRGAVVLTVIAGLVLAAYQLEKSSKEARISIDELSRSIENGMTKGRITSPVISDLSKAQQGLVKDTDATASAWDRFAYSFTNWGAKFSSSATSTKAMTNDFRDLGGAIGKIAQDKGVDTATQALKLLGQQGVHIPTKFLKDYNNALADQAFENKLAAQSMGLFGNQAQSVQKKLAAQKASADGLRQSIQALNDVNRAGLGGMIAFEQSISDTAKAAKADANSLKVRNGQLVLTTQKARDGASALTDLAAKTDAATAAARDSGKSWATVNGIYDRGRAKLIAAAEAMGLTKSQAKALAKQILDMPSKTTTFKGDLTDLQAKLVKAKAQLKTLPPSKQSAIRAEISQLEAQIRKAKADIAGVNGKTVPIKIYYTANAVPGAGTVLAPGRAYGGVIRKFAGGGTVPGYAPMRDTVRAVLSPGEGVLVPEAVRQMGGDAGINSINRQARGSGAGLSASFATLGGHVTGGLTQGLTAGASGAAAAVAGLGKALVASFSTTLGISSPSKVFRSLGIYVNMGLVDGLTGSTAKVKTATKHIETLLIQARNKVADLMTSGKTKQDRSLNSWVRSHEKTIDRLEKYVKREDNVLKSLAAKRDSVATKLKAAQAKLAALQKSWTAERDQISSGIMSGSSIVTAAPQPGFALSGQDVLNSMRDQMARTVQFAANLKALKAKGMRSDLIEQLAAAGVDSGGETAQALASSSKGTIDQINATQKSMKSAADATGAVVADAMYGAGIKSAKGLVKGLQSQEKAIEAQMMRIAKSMEKAIKKALGIKSPSTVMAELGDYTARGMAVGITRSTKHATIAAQGLAMSVRQGATITGGPLPIGGAAAGGGVVHQHFEFHVQGSVATVENLAKDVEAAFLRRGMRNPVTYQSYKR